jgi:hypothetical protein
LGIHTLKRNEGWMSLPATKTTIQIWRLAVLTLVVIILGGRKLELMARQGDGITWGPWEMKGVCLSSRILVFTLILCLSFACCWI